ncbi:MAG: family 10 glycosylhydrolase [Sumerlaeia bacterium]
MDPTHPMPKLAGLAVALMLAAAPMTLDAAGNFPQPTINDRASWNARAPQGSISTLTGLNRAMIHHSAISTDYNTTSLEDSKAKVRAIQNVHMDTNGWSDIGYHFVTDKLGNKFEGREGSLAGLPRGAHDGVNNESMGFCMMGYFHTPIFDQPTVEQRNAIYDLIAWKIPDPFTGLGTGSYGSDPNTPFLGGHRDASATACPGDTMYNTYIGTDPFGGEARLEVNARITGTTTGGGTEVVVDNDDGSPAYAETGGWSTSGAAGYNGGTYRFAQTGDPNTASWTASLPEAGDYEVSVIYVAGSNRPTAARYTVSTSGGTQEAFVDQTVNSLSWQSLGTWNFAAGNATVTLDALGSTPAAAAVIADAVRFTSTGGGTGGTDPAEMRLAVITIFDDINDTIAIQNWVDEIAGLNYNSIAIHTRYRGDATYFPNKTDSTFPNNEPRTSAAGSIDVLEEFTTRGQAAGLKVFAYVNTHLVTDGVDTDFRSNHVINTHPEWRTYFYNGGSPIVQTTTHNSSGLWLEAALPDVRVYLANIAGDIMMNYNCDGIILDRIRYPQTSFTRTNTDFGYHPDAIAAFNAQYAKSGTPDPYDADWIQFRKDAITSTVQEIYNTITAIDPNNILLAYPIGRFNDAINFNYQDWPVWLSNGAIDGVLPQIYTSDNTSFSSRCDTHIAAYTGSRLLGVTTDAYNSGVDVAGQIGITRTKGFDGTSPFRHGVMEALGYFTDLSTAYANPAAWPDMPWKTSPDTTPPAAPTGLAATAGSNQVALDWADNSETDLDGYNVYRGSATGGPYSVIASNINTSAYTDSGVTNGSTYYYVVSALDFSGNESADSAEVNATPDAVDQVAVASADFATDAGTIASGSYVSTQSQNDVSQVLREGESGGKPASRTSLLSHTWQLSVPTGSGYTLSVDAHRAANSEGDDFVISWSKDNASYTPAITITASSDTDTYQSYIFPQDVSGTLYIRIEDTNRTAGQSALDTVSIDHLYVVSAASGGSDTTPPAAPTGLAATGGDASVSLSWNANGETDLAGYTVSRATTSGGPYTALNGTLLTNEAYSDSTVTNGTTYYYVVNAEDAAGNISADSAEASATPTSGGTGGAIVHVSALTVETVNIGGGNKTGRATVTVIDGSGSPVSGAIVDGTFTGSYNESVSGTTNGSGVVVFDTSSSAKGGVSFTFCVDNISASGLTYDPASNSASCAGL